MADTTTRRVFQHPGRVAVVVVGLLVVLNLGVVLLNSADTSPGGHPSLPETVQSISPERGSLTTLIDTVSVDLRDDLTGVLLIDGIEIPEDQLNRVVELGEVGFRPGPGKELVRLRTGDNTVVVLYWRQGKPRPKHPASFGWTFRAAA
ncbi:MAG TPA: hypothetical protein VGA62_01135 [Acidimicrobiia bacterium]